MSAETALHVCHIVSSFTDEVQNRQLLSNLSCSMTKDFEHTVVVLTKSPSQRLIFPGGVSCIELKNKKPLCCRSFKECKKVLSILKPDICHTYGDVPLAMQWLAHQADITLKIHQLATHQTRQHAGWLKTRFLSAMSYSTDWFIASSNEEQSWLSSKAKIKGKQCQVIRPAINAMRFRPTLQQVDPLLTNVFIGTVPIPTDKFVVGLDITHQQIEDIVPLIDQYMAARKLSPAFAKQSLLLIAGNARFLPLIRKELQSRNLNEETVRFVGEVSDYFPFFSHIDALAVAHVIDHISGQQLEAMAMAVPLVSARPKALTLRSEHPIHWTDPKGHCQIKDQLLELFTDFRKRLQLGREARLYVQEKHCAKEYEERLHAIYHLASMNIDKGIANHPQRVYAASTSKSE